jgi:hypothetical protein
MPLFQFLTEYNLLDYYESCVIDGIKVRPPLPSKRQPGPTLITLTIITNPTFTNTRARPESLSQWNAGQSESNF